MIHARICLPAQVPMVDQDWGLGVRCYRIVSRLTVYIRNINHTSVGKSPLNTREFLFR